VIYVKAGLSAFFHWNIAVEKAQHFPIAYKNKKYVNYSFLW